MHAHLLDRMSLPAPPDAARRISPMSKGHFSGHVVVGHGRGRVMETESHNEMNIALVLSMRSDVAELENQVPFCWHNSDDGKAHTHYFDYRAHHTDGCRTAIMVKQSWKLGCPKFMAEATEIARQVTSDFADQVTVMTEKDVDPIALHNAEYLNGLRDRDPEADSAVRRAVARTIGAVPIKEIVGVVNLQGRAFRAVGRLLRSRELELARNERITPDALVMKRNA